MSGKIKIKRKNGGDVVVQYAKLSTLQLFSSGNRSTDCGSCNSKRSGNLSCCQAQFLSASEGYYGSRFAYITAAAAGLQFFLAYRSL